LLETRPTREERGRGEERRGKSDTVVVVRESGEGWEVVVRERVARVE